MAVERCTGIDHFVLIDRRLGVVFCVHEVDRLTCLDVAVEAIRCPLIAKMDCLSMEGLFIGTGHIRKTVTSHNLIIFMTLSAHLYQLLRGSQLLHAGGKMAVKFLYIDFIVMTDQAPSYYPLGYAGVGRFKIVERSVEWIIMAGFAIGKVFLILFEVAVLISCGMHTAFKEL
jgi:hypothetical protein